jgi:hypothetical protein
MCRGETLGAAPPASNRPRAAWRRRPQGRGDAERVGALPLPLSCTGRRARTWWLNVCVVQKKLSRTRASPLTRAYRSSALVNAASFQDEVSGGWGCAGKWRGRAAQWGARHGQGLARAGRPSGGAPPPCHLAPAALHRAAPRHAPSPSRPRPPLTGTYSTPAEPRGRFQSLTHERQNQWAFAGHAAIALPQQLQPSCAYRGVSKHGGAFWTVPGLCARSRTPLPLKTWEGGVDGGRGRGQGAGRR